MAARPLTCRGTLRRLPDACQCGHLFCYDCIKYCVESSGACPVCGAGVQLSQVIAQPDLADMEDETDGLVPSRPGSAEPGKSRPSTPTTQKKGSQSLVDLAIRGKAKPTNKERVRGRLRGHRGGQRARPDGGRASRVAWEGDRGRSQYRPSAKVLALLEFLDATRNKDRKIKTVVFSQWTTMLNIIEVREPGRARGVRRRGRLTASVRRLCVARIRRRSCTSATTALCGSMGR